jgi:hypothetical protein
MSTLSKAENHWSPLKAIGRWWLEWTEAAPRTALQCMAEEQVQRVAEDVGLTPHELRHLVSLGPDAADLLLRRMAALDLDKHEIARVECRTFQDMQRVCAMCESHRRCKRDLADHADSSVWKNYCPNVATLMALNTLPWESRREC